MFLFHIIALGDYMKNNKKYDLYLLIYALSIIVFYALGVLISTFIKRSSICYEFIVYNLDFKSTFSEFIASWIFQLIPFLMVILSGYDFLGGFYCIIVLVFKAFLSGSSCAFCFLENYISKDFTGIVLFIFYTFVESMFLILLLSGAVEQDRFRRFYYFKNHTSPFKCGVNHIYLRHSYIRGGVMVLIYIIKCLICYLIEIY